MAMRAIATFFMIFWMSACAALSPSVPPAPVTLQSQIAAKETIELPLLEGLPGERQSSLIIIPAVLPNGETGRFILDTGATLSSIFKSTQGRLGVTTESESPIRVHGMVSAKIQPVATLETLQLGSRNIGPLRVAVIDREEDLQSRKQVNDTDVQSDGIIGMDVLQNYHLYYDPAIGKVWLLPLDIGAPAVPRDWEIVKLVQNPFLEDGRALHFFNLGMSYSITPALLDTGSEFNLMNWDTKRFPQLRERRRSMRREWKISGAVGSFKPVAKIIADRTRSGDRSWSNNEFVVRDFENLNVLGIDGNPFVIAGMPMLSTRPMVLDFENDRAYFAPAQDEKTHSGLGEVARP